MSEWIVPKTEIPGRSNPGSAGPACVPGDLRKKPKLNAAIPNRIARSPKQTHTSPAPAARDSANAASPDARGRKHADYGNNRSRGCYGYGVAEAASGLFGFTLDWSGSALRRFCAAHLRRISRVVQPEPVAQGKQSRFALTSMG